MRIAHIITRLIVGGAQENTLLSCEGQHDRGHDVLLITGPAIGPEGSLMARARGYGYRVAVIDDMRRAILPVKDFCTCGALVSLLERFEPDIVHTHSSKAGIIGRWSARITELGAARGTGPGAGAIVHTIHGLAFTASTSPLVNGMYKLLERATAPITTRIICVADAMRDQSLAAGIGRRRQYATVYSGMRTDSFIHPPVSREIVRAQLGLEPRHIVVGTIARLFDLKGHDDLLDIAPKLCGDIPDLRFLWVGDGSLRSAFEARMASMGLRDRFILSGLVAPEVVPQLTGAMDILVHPSRREGLARALPQASLAAKPAITYDIDGAKEAIIDGRTGFVLPPFDKEKLAGAIAMLANDPPRRAAMGAAGRLFALARFDASVMVDALERVYEEALAARRPRAPARLGAT